MVILPKETTLWQLFIIVSLHYILKSEEHLSQLKAAVLGLLALLPHDHVSIRKANERTKN